MKTIDAPPQAKILIESMRDIGYTLETALADVVDNSISAGARNISIHVDSTSSSPKLAISDDGSGMTRIELIEAMRLGSKHPRDARRASDLGRFGLGMKTASFSQCRRLTVVARVEGITSAAVWDLDEIEAANNWALGIVTDYDAVPFIEELGAVGVLVVWEKLDRAVELGGSNEARRDFVHRVDEARSYLELVFHRFLAPDGRLKKVTMSINNSALVAYDPFHSTHPATQRGETEVIGVGKQQVEVTPFALPHHNNVSPEDWEHYGGKAGYLKNQGFYLYRARRLIVFGTWFHLARQSEITRLARVRVDIPNGLDAEWHVDVKKASARPPLQVRERLKAVIAQLAAPAKRVYVRRGARLHGSAVSLWDRVQRDNQIIYAVNLESPLIKEFVGELNRELAEAFARLMRAVGAGLPLDAIFADLASSPESVAVEALDPETLEHLLKVSLDRISLMNGDRGQAIDLLQRTEPFRSNWDATERLLELHADRMGT